MIRKIFLTFIIVLSIVFCSSFVFATNNENMTNGISDAMNNAENKTENAVQGATNVVRDTVSGITDTTKNAVNGLTDSAKNTVNDITNSTDEKNNYNNDNNTAMTTNNSTTTANTTGNYTTSRTSANGTLMGMNSTTWIWIIMGVAAVTIIGLVWYYSMQLTEKSYDDNGRE